MKILDLPYPHSDLSPNSRCHWAVKARAVKSSREAAHMLAKSITPTLEFRVEFHPPNKNRRDLDNAIASCKSLIDGIAEAWGVDDSQFIIHWPTEFAEPVKGGAVLLYRMEGR